MCSAYFWVKQARHFHWGRRGDVKHEKILILYFQHLRIHDAVAKNQRSSRGEEKSLLFQRGSQKKNVYLLMFVHLICIFEMESEKKV